MNDALHHDLAGFAAHARVLVALDFDGTLAELADDPQSVFVLPHSARALADLAVDDGVHLALVSGRPASELERLAAPPAGTILIGSHGSEIATVDAEGNLHAADLGLTEEERTLLTDLVATLEDIASGAPGAWVEVKPVAAVLHTRLSTDADAEVVIERALAGPARWQGVHAMKGKDVVEFSVRTLTKGDALGELRERTATGEAIHVLFAGDDVTDEHGFAVLGDGDVGIKVGSGDTRAAHRVADPEEFGRVLEALVALRQSPA
ncbi:MAG: trehalose-phosphatase [Actinobacteria bacterium]|nr:trehalose-phosphatase [Actinomycetota bacterium]